MLFVATNAMDGMLYVRKVHVFMRHRADKLFYGLAPSKYVFSGRPRRSARHLCVRCVAVGLLGRGIVRFSAIGQHRGSVCNHSKAQFAVEQLYMIACDVQTSSKIAIL